MKKVLEYKDFVGSVSFSEEDNVYFGKVEGINDLISYEGRNMEELTEAFHYMIDKHIEDCVEENIPPK